MNKDLPIISNCEFAYYLPRFVNQWFASHCPDQQSFCDLFSVLGGNSSIIDRTGCITMPFAVKNLYPIPQQTQHVKDFGSLCIERARAILAENKPVYLMYSGGLDSTSMLVAFHHVIANDNLDSSQLIVTTSLDAVGENAWAWHNIIIPHYKLAVTRDVLDTIDMTANRYVQGENADQLFGSDRIFSEPELIYEKFNADSLARFLERCTSNKDSHQRLHNELSNLAAQCPLPIDYMRDFLWWLNFSCKWQCVALRTLNFSNIFEKHSSISLQDIGAFETFFNTIEFQQLALSGKLDKWGTQASAHTYKYAARDFILRMTGESEWTSCKVKVGSLYNIMKQRPFVAQAIIAEGNELKPITVQ